MSSTTFPLIGGRVMRVTREDACGLPLWGDSAQVVSDGWVSVAVTANYDDGTEIVVRNAAGRRCINKAAEPELVNLGLTAVFCDVNPDLYTAVTGFPQIVDPASGNVIGFRVNRSVRPRDVGLALEVWTSALEDGCDVDGEVPYGYLLWAFLSGGRIGDYTIENNAVTFTVSDMLTRDGGQWGNGPYDVVTDDGGDPGPLTDEWDSMDHQIVVRTTVPPPEETDGLVPLDDPDETDATGAAAGIPGHFTPTGAVRPFDLAALIAGSIIAAPATAWTTGQYVVLGDGSKAHWNATAWVAGAAA